MKLLVSPIDRVEARAAVKGGADIIDAKNPLEGSLGAAFPWVVKEIKAVVPSNVELSAALGDLDFKPGTASLAACALADIGVDYIKAGFRMANESQAFEMAEKISRAVSGSGVKLVLAGYADYRYIDSVPPFTLLEVAEKTGASVVMIDTARKNGKNLLEHMSLSKLIEFVHTAHKLGLKVALAGSLGLNEIREVRKIGADIVGVRGAVCAGGDRIGGRIVSRKVREIKAMLEE